MLMTSKVMAFFWTATLAVTICVQYIVNLRIIIPVSRVGNFRYAFISFFPLVGTVSIAKGNTGADRLRKDTSLSLVLITESISAKLLIPMT